MHTSRLRFHAAALLAGVVLSMSACSGGRGDDVADAAIANTSEATVAPTTSGPPTTASRTEDTTPPSTAPPTPTPSTAPPPSPPPPPTTVPDVTMDDWQRQVAAICDPVVEGIGPFLSNDGTASSMEAQVAGLRRLLPGLDQLEPPAEFADDLEHILAVGEEAEAALVMAEAGVAAGDVAAVDAAIEIFGNHLVRVGSGLILTGARCNDDPARAATADLSVVAGPGAGQLDVGFGSVWVSNRLAGTVDRIDPVTGATIATVEVGASPLKLQAADGRMWVRTRDSYDAVDPETNTVTATLAKADVGPAANRSWAVDGAMWICDGDRVHRYDPTSLMPVATVDIGVDCGQVYATDDLVVAWNYNEDLGESGSTVAVMIDPTTNAAMASVPLPIDVTVPVVLPDHVYFAGNRNSSAVVVDRADWAVSGPLDLGTTVGTSQNGFDGERIYVGTYGDSPPAILVVDPSTFEVIEQIDVLNVNSIAVLDGSVWVVDEDLNVLQRFDIASQ